MNKQTASLYVPKNVDKFDDFILLDDRLSGEKYTINDSGVIISEKLAKLLGVSVNDTIILKDEDNNSHQVKVYNITENYVSHYVYCHQHTIKRYLEKSLYIILNL